MSRGRMNNKGITLVELMIAMAISAILLIGVGTIYGKSKRTYSIDDEFAQLQENARIAMKYIVEDIRMSGYLGCLRNQGSDPETFKCFVAGYACDSAAQGLEGFDANGTQANLGTAKSVDADSNGVIDVSTSTNDFKNKTNGTKYLPAEFPIASQPLLASDIIVTRYGAGSGLQMSQDQDPSWIKISRNGADVPTAGSNDCHTPSNICENEVLMISDCNKARVFKVSSLVNATGDIQIEHADDTPSATWGGAPNSPDNFEKLDSEVMRFRTHAYYVANNLKGEPALFRHNGISGSPSDELVEGIENLQILYGIDDGNDLTINRYISADQVDFTDTNNPVVAVRISILVRSKKEVVAGPAKQVTYKMATTPIKSLNDKRLRKTFTTTVKIRNKGA